MRPCLAALAVGLASLAAFYATKLPGLGWDDTPELALAVECHGIPHSPGFALFVLLGRVAMVLGGTSGAQAATAVAAWCAAAAAGLATWRVASRLGSALGGAAGICVGCSPVVWHHATQGEVYTLHLLLATVLLCMREASTRRGAFAGGYVFGLALGNHPSSLALFPLLVPSLRKRPALCAAGILASLSLLATLPLRSAHLPYLDWGRTHTPKGFLWLITLQEFKADAVAGRLVAGGNAWGAFQTIGRFLTSSLPLLVLGLAAAGVPLMARRAPQVLASVVALALGSAAIGGGPDVFGYLLPLCPLIVFSAAETIGLLRFPARVSASALIASVALLAPHSQIRDRSGDHSAERYQEALASQLKGRVLFTDSSTDLFLMLEHAARTPTHPPVVYTPYLGLDWYRATLEPALASMLPARPDPPYQAAVEAAHATGFEPVFTFSNLPDGARTVLVPEGLILRGGAYDPDADMRLLSAWPTENAGRGQGGLHRSVRVAQGGQLLAARGNHRGAAARFAEAALTGPGNVEVWRSLVEALARSQSCEEVGASASAYLRVAPATTAAAEAVARAAAPLQTPCETVTALMEHLARRFPRSGRITEEAARRALIDGAPGRAVRILGASSLKESAELLNLRAVALMLHGDYAAARDVFVRAIEIADAPTRNRIEANLALCRRQMELAVTARAGGDATVPGAGVAGNGVRP